MARILILANNDVGLYKFRKELIEELLGENEVYIALPYGEFIPNLLSLGCKFIETPLSRRGTNPLTDLKLFLLYMRVIKRVNPDVVLTYTIKPNVYGGIACRIQKVPYIANITGLGTAVESGGVLQKLTLTLYSIALKNAQNIFFQNKENEKFFIHKKIVAGNQMLIPGSGVNLNYYSIMDYPKSEDMNFVFIGRIMKEKGIDQYLEAATYIKSQYSNVNFHVLGFCEQPYQERLKDLQNEGIIFYHGMQSDIRKFLITSHCTVHPTYYPEGMSNVLLESAAVGRPIITTNRSGCMEIVDDGINGYIVKPQNSLDLINKIEMFIKLDYESRKAMGEASRRKIEREFDRNIVVNAYMKSIRSIL